MIYKILLIISFSFVSCNQYDGKKRNEAVKQFYLNYTELEQDEFLKKNFHKEFSSIQSQIILKVVQLDRKQGLLIKRKRDNFK